MVHALLPEHILPQRSVQLQSARTWHLKVPQCCKLAA